MPPEVFPFFCFEIQNFRPLLKGTKFRKINSKTVNLHSSVNTIIYGVCQIAKLAKAVCDGEMIAEWIWKCTFVIFQILMYNTLADLGGVPGARPLRVQILSFWHTKFSKRNRLGSQRPPARSTPPLREILDPPLKCIYKSIIPYTKTLEHSPMNLFGSLLTITYRPLPNWQSI